MFDASLQPGVVVRSTMMAGADSDNQTAIPVFVGFTERGGQAELYRLENADDYTRLCGQPDPAGDSILAHAVNHFFDNQGDLCYVLSAGEYAALAALDSEQVAVALIAALADTQIAGTDEISLLAVPDCVLLDGADSVTWCALWDAMLEARGGRAELFCLLDTPADPHQADACRRTFWRDDAVFAAAYWPHLVSRYRDAAGQFIVLPPSAAVAAAYRSTDRRRGVWKAPANLPLSQTVRPQYSHLSGGQLFDMDGASINLIRSFSGRGVRIWGCRTLGDDPASSWRYVQTRRLMSFVQMALREQLGFALFEPNNEMTWFKVKAMAYGWLRGLWQAGALAGKREEDAFQVLLGLGESMSEDDIANGCMVLKIHLALQAPAEFVQLSLLFDTRQGDAVAVVSNHTQRRRLT